MMTLWFILKMYFADKAMIIRVKLFEDQQGSTKSIIFYEHVGRQSDFKTGVLFKD